MKHQPVTALMHSHVESIGLDDTVRQVESLLSVGGLSWAPVVGDTGELIGAISTTDIVRFHTGKGDPDATHAWQLCSYRPIRVAPDATLGEVARLMLDRHIHHVVVADGTAIRGVVSSLDFVRTFAG